MGILDKLTDRLIKRRMKQRHIKVVDGDTPESELQFRRVLNTLRENNIMVSKKNDGIYIRFAGEERKGELFSKEFVKVTSYVRKVGDFSDWLLDNGYGYCGADKQIEVLPQYQKDLEEYLKTQETI